MIRVVAVLVTLLAASASVLAAPPIESWRTDTGAKVMYVHTDALPIVDVRVVFHAGGARDHDLPGLSQLTHSLLDQGTAELDADAIALQLESVGARLSGSSQRDMAYLQLRSLTDPEALEPAIAAFSRILGEPAFPQEALARQRARMLVGLQAAQREPSVLAQRAFYRAIYRDHPYSTPPDGTEEGLKAIDRDEVVAFYRRYYTAPNAVIAIVGDVDRATAESIAERLTAGLPEGPEAPPLPEVPPLEDAPTVDISFPSSQTHLILGQPSIARAEPGIFAMSVGNHILGGGGLVSLLTTAMREERGLSYSTASYFVPSQRKGPFAIETQVRTERAGEALEVLRELLSEFRTEGPTAEQLRLAKLNITGGFPLNIDSNSEIVAYAAMIGFYDLPLDYLDTYTDAIEAVTAEDVKEAFNKYLDPEHMALIRVGPQAE